MSTKKMVGLLGAIGVVLFAQAASANSTINVSYLGDSYGYGAGRINPSPKSGSAYVEIGAFDMRNNTSNAYDFAAPSVKYSAADEFVAWCVDPLHWLQYSHTYNVGGVDDMITAFGSTRVNDLQSLANQHYAEVDTTIESAAFQVATWTILYGNDSNGDGKYDFNLAGSAFRATYLTPYDPDGAGPGLGVKDLAISYLAGLSTGQNTGNFKLNYLFDDCYGAGGTGCSQDLVTFTPSPVPLPAAAWLFGSALIGFVSLSSRKKV